MDLEEIWEQLQARTSELEADRALLGNTKRLFVSAGARLNAR
jgi:hypothetical protein